MATESPPQSAAERAWRRGLGAVLLPDGSEPCLGRHATYFPDRTQGGWQQEVEKAKRLCRGCHRQLECFATAEMRREATGVWGGVDFHDRFAKRRAILRDNTPKNVC